jgi:hypothetical protein
MTSVGRRVHRVVVALLGATWLASCADDGMATPAGTTDELSSEAGGATSGDDVDVSTSAVDDSGGSTTSDGAGSESGDASDDGPPQPDCRTYPTQYVFASSLGADATYTCTHAETADGFDRICEQGDATDTEHWASTADFVNEAGAVGVRHVLSSTRELFGTDYVTTFQYDDAGRLTEVLLDRETLSLYDAWDELGRPTHGTMHGDCAGGEIVWAYDDAARTITTTRTGGARGCEGTDTTTFDENMNRESVDYDDGVTATYTNLSTATVCK